MKSIKQIVLISIIIVFCAFSSTNACTPEPTDVNFGTYVSLSATNLDITHLIQFTCPPDQIGPRYINVVAGMNSNGSFHPRRMAMGNYFIDYNIYTDATYTQVWGDGTSNTGVVLAASNVNMYLRIPAGQNVGPGDYSDLLTITVVW